jgi:hypothetical protein
MPLARFLKCLLQAAMILGIVTSSKKNGTNSCGPVLSYFLAFPVASVARGCTVIYLFSKILEPQVFLLASPHFVLFCFVATFVRFSFIFCANFFHLLISDMAKWQNNMAMSAPRN